MSYAALENYNAADAKNLPHRNIAYGDRLNWALIAGMSINGLTWLLMLAALVA